MPSGRPTEKGEQAAQIHPSRPSRDPMGTIRGWHIATQCELLPTLFLSTRVDLVEQQGDRGFSVRANPVSRDLWPDLYRDSDNLPLSGICHG